MDAIYGATFASVPNIRFFPVTCARDGMVTIVFHVHLGLPSSKYPVHFRRDHVDVSSNALLPVVLPMISTDILPITSSGVVSETTIFVAFLPPIICNAVLPKGYPSHEFPEISLTCAWLSKAQSRHMENKLYQLWETQIGNPILFACGELLMETTLCELNLLNSLSLSNDVLCDVPRGSVTVSSDTTNLLAPPTDSTEVADIALHEIFPGTTGATLRTHHDVTKPFNMQNLFLHIRDYDEHERTSLFQKQVYLLNMFIALSRTGTVFNQIIKYCPPSFFLFHFFPVDVTGSPPPPTHPPTHPPPPPPPPTYPPTPSYFPPSPPRAH